MDPPARHIFISAIIEGWQARIEETLPPSYPRQLLIMDKAHESVRTGPHLHLMVFSKPESLIKLL
jgi:hypothetical protein